MPRTTTGTDTWAGSAEPGATHNPEAVLRVATGAQETFVFLNPAVPLGSSVQSAKLQLYAKGASSGSRTLSCRRITGDWRARDLSWSNRPAVAASDTDTEAINVLADQDLIEFDVTADVALYAAGTPPRGWRIQTTGASHKFYSFQSGVRSPVLVVTYSLRPAKPTGLMPAGLVGVSQPTLQWNRGAGDQASYRVQADPASNGTTPAYDSGVQTSTLPQHALGGTAFAQLPSDGSVTYWRVQVTNAAGQTSDWSDWMQITRDNKGTLTITNPATSPNNIVWEPTPPILATFTGETLTAFEVAVTPASDRANVRYDSGKVPGSSISHTLPELGRDGARLLVNSGSYSLRVRAYDAKVRQGSAAAGDEPYVEAWRDFTMSDDGTVTGVSGLTVVQDGSTPVAVLEWTRATAPDSFVVLRDGVPLKASLLPADALVSGTTYRYRDATAKPATAHVYTVKAVVAGKQSNNSASATLTGGTKVEGTWLYDPETSRYIVASGIAVGDWQHTEIGATFLPLGARAGFRITQVLGGLSGSFDGLVVERTWRTVLQMEADFWRMKEDAPSSPDFRLVGDTMNIPVQAFNLSWTVAGEASFEGYRRRNFRFGFYQTGEFEFAGKT